MPFQINIWSNFEWKRSRSENLFLFCVKRNRENLYLLFSQNGVILDKIK